MKLITIVLIALITGFTASASASPLLVVTCQPPTGINLSAESESQKPKGAIPEKYETDAGAFVSHPRNTHASIFTVNNDGTATETTDTDAQNTIATTMHVLGTVNESAITLTDGENGDVNLVTLYPKEAVAIFAGTSYFGWHKGVATGYTYISHCHFSNVIH